MGRGAPKQQAQSKHCEGELHGESGPQRVEVHLDPCESRRAVARFSPWLKWGDGGQLSSSPGGCPWSSPYTALHLDLRVCRGWQVSSSRCRGLTIGGGWHDTWVCWDKRGGGGGVQDLQLHWYGLELCLRATHPTMDHQGRGVCENWALTSSLPKQVPKK